MKIWNFNMNSSEYFHAVEEIVIWLYIDAYLIWYPSSSGHQVQSLKEFCGTGDMGQTLSIATITTDIDTNEKSAITRSETMV